MKEFDLSQWVEQEETPIDRQFREAVHVILFAISRCQYISTQMIMKGAVLLAIRYNCIRHTTDIDFSTSKLVTEFDEKKFFSGLSESLVFATEALDYGVDCKIQSFKYKPPSADASFPTLKIKIGYAYKHDQRSHKRLLKGNSSKVIAIDYSFNEKTYNIENLLIKNGGTLLAYSFTDLVAEKYRAILQQSARNRTRRQDVYDLYELFRKSTASNNEKEKILQSLIKKSAARGITVDRHSLADPEIKRRSQQEYYTLKSEIIGDLPNFEEAYYAVQFFYESLPWDQNESD